MKHYQNNHTWLKNENDYKKQIPERKLEKKNSEMAKLRT